MNYIEIKNVQCWGNLNNAECVLISTCEDSYTITPKSTWIATVNYILKDDKYMQECAKNGELQIEVA
tara:strand:- start:596 stop:796 length:201 start_codon:yes stop_codon:yes gene_type:complete